MEVYGKDGKMQFENAAHKKEFLRLQASWKERVKELKEIHETNTANGVPTPVCWCNSCQALRK